ncbi:MAG: S8 family serine peptidase [Syntrophothermus sp.]|uniref:S8 family serine peptidase n=1 Tax=Syntrophothermus sp. TaxID=2736299 RepID=UPI00257D3ECF|nr:S8 family serine peptidase [Syntrophothermus sp.]NSW81715.1 S8 family serine peptidase [Syntrophothermus sp.]
MWKKIRSLIALVLSTCLLSGFLLYIDTAYVPAVWVSSRAREVSFLNDRTADLIGCTPITARDLAVPGGLTGRGQVVGLADSGLDKGNLLDMHPDLTSVPGEIPKIVSLGSWAGRAVPDDPVGHGTHMAATIAGTGKASGGKYKGIAPNASLYFQALLDPSGKLQVPQDVAGMFLAAYRAGVRVHVNGWGTSGNTYSRTAQQVDAFVRAYPEFLPVFGAGNSGPGKGTLTEEANSKNALVVGAAQTPRPSFGPDARDAEEPASFSSRGPTADGRIKPDLMVPASAVISACSRLTESNFAADPDYTRMGGTSMAAAITGGAVALLTEYLEKEGVANPSAALLKALLIDGSRPSQQNVMKLGFGTLDLAQTILMLEEELTRFEDDRQGLATGQERAWKVRVREPQLPLIVTLVWTDAVGQGGAGNLVNDLDLVVEGPDGEVYTGNHFLGLSGPDNSNNVEQVRIEHPVTGEYTVRVKAASVRVGATGSGGLFQDYALVYGQQPARDVLIEGDHGSLRLAGLGTVSLDARQPVMVVNGETVPFTSGRVLPGSDVYLGAERAYIFGRTYQAGGVQVLSSPQGEQLMEVNPQVRAGGYLIDDRAKREIEGVYTLNGESVSSSELPAGIEVWATVNPSTQRAWLIKASYRKETGVVQAVDYESRTLKLLEEATTYKVRTDTLVTFLDECVDSGLNDRPYGTSQASGLEGLLPGMPVELYVSPVSGDVMYVAVKREVVQGRVTQVDPDTGKLILETGKEYSCFPGLPVTRDGEKTQLSGVKLGDYAKLVLVPKSNRVLALEAYSKVLYGQVIYLVEKQKKLYLTGQDNVMRELNLDQETQVFRWDLPVDVAGVQPGSWVRAVIDGNRNTVLRMDVAEVAEDTTGRFDAYREATPKTVTVGGNSYLIADNCLVTKGGYWIEPQDLVSGDEVRLVALSLQGSGQKLAALVAAQVKSSLSKPFLMASVKELNGVLVVDGQTSGYAVYVYRADGSRTRLKADQAGRFSALLAVHSGEREVELVTLDKNGGLAFLRVGIEPFSPSRGETRTFADISGKPDNESIARLAESSVVAGYPDGTYRPNKPITRLEFLLILVRAGGGRERSAVAKEFLDQKEVPAWARQDLAEAVRRGLVAGYPDGTLRPNQPVTRAEMAAMLVRAFGAGFGGKPPYTDLKRTPSWARPAVVQAWSRGLLDGLRTLLYRQFYPYRHVTRFEAALCVARGFGIKG